MFFIENLLVYILMFPIIGILLLLLVPSRETRLLKFIALNSACFSFIGSLILWGSFSKSIGFFQFLVKLSWFPLLTLNLTLNRTTRLEGYGEIHENPTDTVPGGNVSFSHSVCRKYLKFHTQLVVTLVRVFT